MADAILVPNADSSSLKFSVFPAGTTAPRAELLPGNGAAELPVAGEVDAAEPARGVRPAT